MSNGGFIKFMRSDNARELLKRPKAFCLLALIAQRAKRSDELSIHDLGIGEALIGDRGSVGLSQQEYRSAKAFLEKLQLATFRATNRGTVARLTDKTIFDINLAPDNRQVNHQETNRQHTKHKQGTTKKNEKKEELSKNDNKNKEYINFKRNFIKKTTMPQPDYEDLLRYR